MIDCNLYINRKILFCNYEEVKLLMIATLIVVIVVVLRYNINPSYY